MVGPENSIIGDDADAVLCSFLTKMPHRFSIGKGNPIFDAMVIEVNESTGKAISIKRVREKGYGE
jgi:hypothetical protein